MGTGNTTQTRHGQQSSNHCSALPHLLLFDRRSMSRIRVYFCKRYVNQINSGRSSTGFNHGSYTLKNLVHIRATIHSDSVGMERYEIGQILAMDLTQTIEENTIHLDSINCHELVVTFSMATTEHSDGQFLKLLTESTNLRIVNSCVLDNYQMRPCVWAPSQCHGSYY